MLTRVDAYVVFDDFSTAELIGEWRVDFSIKSGLGSQQSLTDYLTKNYAKKGKKVQFVSIFPAEKVAG